MSCKKGQALMFSILNMVKTQQLHSQLLKLKPTSNDTLQHDKNSTQYQLGIFYFDITCLSCDISEISFYFFVHPYIHPYPI